MFFTNPKLLSRRALTCGYLAPLPIFIACGALMARGADTPRPVLAPVAPAQKAYAAEIRPLTQQFCVGCHTATSPSGGVNLEKYGDIRALQRDQAAGRKMVIQIRERTMPPKGSPQPTQDQREQLAHGISFALDNAPDDLIPRDPGRVLIHRLSRTEYNNTVRDLFGVTSRPADAFPADGGGGGGFDNNADTLFIPPILMERYLDAASAILSEAKPARVFFVRPSKTLPPRAAARRILSGWAFRAYRRPVDASETARLMRLYDAAMARGDGFEASVRFALKLTLISPNFLFRAELPVKPSASGGAAARLGDYELASRLSYFLWASTPDDELLRLAGENKLRDPVVLDKQVQRMLQSPKSRGFADSFAGQWLRVRELYATAQPDPSRFPEYTPVLRDAMYGEVISLFDNLVRNDGSLLRLIDADYTYLNEPLARHYGIVGVTGPKLRRVHLTDRRRGGVATSAAVLTLTSYPQRTSPVLRGKWALEELFGAPAPPPPPNAGGLPADDAPNKEGITFRQRLEAHRAKPECASCHSRMDPLGFGLENFDGIGKWRDKIGATEIDARGVLATGESFTGPVELKRLLLTRKDEFARNVSEKMLAYALGRGLTPSDLPAVRRITGAVIKNDYRTGTLIREIVRSYPFQYRSGEPAKTVKPVQTAKSGAAHL